MNKPSAQVMLVIVSIIYGILAISYAVITPPWEAPDEPAHYRYVAELAWRWQPPVDSQVRQKASFSKDYAYISSNYEWYQPALGYLPSAIIYKVLDTFFPDSLPKEIPPLNPLFSVNPLENPNLFLREFSTLDNLWQKQWGLMVIRIASSLWGLGVIFFTYRIGCLIEGAHSYLGILAAGLVAFLPQFTFISASVRSDTFTNAIAAGVFWLAIRMLSAQNNERTCASGLGILLGIGILSKYTFLYMVAVALLPILLAHPRSPRKWLQPMFYLVLPAAIIVGAYYIAFDQAREALAYTLNTTLKIKPDAFTWAYLQRIPEPLLVNLFYAGFGWANVYPQLAFGQVAFALWLIGVFITVVQTWRYRNRLIEKQAVNSLILLGVGYLIALGGVIRFNLSVLQPQGRFLFPALAAWAILGVWGTWQALPTRGKMIGGLTCVGLMLAYNVYALVYVLLPAYHHP